MLKEDIKYRSGNMKAYLPDEPLKVGGFMAQLMKPIYDDEKPNEKELLFIIVEEGYYRKFIAGYYENGLFIDLDDKIITLDIVTGWINSSDLESYKEKYY